MERRTWSILREKKCPHPFMYLRDSRRCAFAPSVAAVAQKVCYRALQIFVTWSVHEPERFWGIRLRWQHTTLLRSPDDLKFIAQFILVWTPFIF